MTSTPSSILRLELMGSGDQPGTWGNTTNINLGSLLEGAIAGVANVSVSSVNQAFVALNYAPDQARMAIIKLTTTGAVTTNFSVYAPPVSKVYVIQNNSAYVATIFNSTIIGNTVAAGVGVTVGAGENAVVFSDGINFSGLSFATGVVPIIRGGTGATTPVNARTNLGLTIGSDVAPISSPAFTGTPTAPTAGVGTNNTQIATTAYVAAQIVQDAPSKTGAGASGSWNINASTANKFASTAGAAPVFAVRVWANINGNGAATIRDSGNVSSVVYNGPGDYTINFATPLPTSNYALVATANNYNYGQALTASVKYADGSLYGTSTPTLRTTSAVRIVVGIGNSTTYIDATELNVMILA